MKTLNWRRVSVALVLVAAMAAIVTSIADSWSPVKKALSQNLFFDRTRSGERMGRVDSVRALVENNVPQGASLFVVNTDAPGLQTLEYSRKQMFVWMLGPRNVKFGDLRGAGDAPFILIADGTRAQLRTDGMDLGKYQKLDTAEYLSLWGRKDFVHPRGGGFPRESIAPLRELSGVLAVISTFAVAVLCAGLANGILMLAALSAAAIACALIKVHSGAIMWALLFCVCASSLFTFVRGKRREAIAVGRTNTKLSMAFFLTSILGAAYSLVTSALALSHTLRSPYGLGISGGRAKMLFAFGAEALPMLFGDSMKFLEPSYPPGHVGVVLTAYLAAGGCGEWIIQLLGSIFMTAVFILAIRNSKSVVSAALIIAMFVSPRCLKLGGLMYPEPFMWLCLIAGWLAVMKNSRNLMGWFILGASGWFKNEGLIIAMSAWIATLFARGVLIVDEPGGRLARCRLALSQLAAVLALPLAWHAVSRLCGAYPNDYGGIRCFNVMNCAVAASEFARLAFLRPANYALVFPVAIIIGTLLRFLHVGAAIRKRFSLALAFAVICAVAFVATYGFSLNPDIKWHIATSLPRLLYAPALVLLLEISSIVDAFSRDAAIARA